MEKFYASAAAAVCIRHILLLLSPSPHPHTAERSLYALMQSSLKESLLFNNSSTQLKARPRIYLVWSSLLTLFPIYILWKYMRCFQGAIHRNGYKHKSGCDVIHARSLFLFKFIINARNNETIQQNILWDALKQATKYIRVYSYIE